MSIIETLEKAEHALTVPEVSRLLSVSQRTIYQYAASGRIPALKIGSAIRFDPHELARWIRQREMQSA